jgi:tRNA A37 threonylcarbamoyladenosine synthetase subunit TsaC/SUA5/YrdC
MAKMLTERFWPGGLTIMLPKKDTYHDIVTAGMIGVSVRLPSNETARELIEKVIGPVHRPCRRATCAGRGHRHCHKRQAHKGMLLKGRSAL